MDRLNKILKSGSLVAFVVAMLTLSRLFYSLEVETRSRQAVVESLPAIVQSELAATREATFSLVDQHANRIEVLVNGRIYSLETVLDRHADRLETLASAQLDQTNATVAKLAADTTTILDSRTANVTANVGSLLARYEAIPTQAAEANRWLWDCKEFSGCLQSQTLALVGSARATMGAVAKAAPQVAESAVTSSTAFAEGFPVVVADVGQITENVKERTRVRWYDRLLGLGATGLLSTLIGVR